MVHQVASRAAIAVGSCSLKVSNLELQAGPARRTQSLCQPPALPLLPRLAYKPMQVHDIAMTPRYDGQLGIMPVSTQSTKNSMLLLAGKQEGWVVSHGHRNDGDSSNCSTYWPWYLHNLRRQQADCACCALQAFNVLLMC